MPVNRPKDDPHFQPEWQGSDPAIVGDAVITTDTDGFVTSLNPIAESLTGWTHVEAAGVSLENIFKIVHPETRTTIESPTVRALREGVIVGLPDQTVLIAKDGKEYPIGPIDHSATPIRNDQGELTGAVLVFRDVTYIRIQDRKVRTALAYAQSIIATLREPFLVLDKNLRVRTANRTSGTYHACGRCSMRFCPTMIPSTTTTWKWTSRRLAR
jgi:PAS domain S-box-containing protein